MRLRNVASFNFPSASSLKRVGSEFMRKEYRSGIYFHLSIDVNGYWLVTSGLDREGFKFTTYSDAKMYFKYSMYLAHISSYSLIKW